MFAKGFSVWNPILFVYSQICTWFICYLQGFFCVYKNKTHNWSDIFSKLDHTHLTLKHFFKTAQGRDATQIKIKPSITQCRTLILFWQSKVCKDFFRCFHEDDDSLVSACCYLPHKYKCNWIRFLKVHDREFR